MKPRIRLKPVRPALVVHDFQREQVAGVRHVLDKAAELAEDGELVEVVLFGQCRDSTLFWARSELQSASRTAGQMIQTAIRMMGFKQES